MTKEQFCQIIDLLKRKIINIQINRKIDKQLFDVVKKMEMKTSEDNPLIEQLKELTGDFSFPSIIENYLYDDDCETMIAKKINTSDELWNYLLTTQN